VTVLSIVLGLRLMRGARWAWVTTLVLCGLLVTVVPLLVFVLPARPVFAIVPAAWSVVSAVLLVTGPARAYVSGSDR
jgi:hypothetical protein